MRNKFLALALVLTMTAAFVGCGNKGTEVQKAATSVEETVETAEDAVEETVEETAEEAETEQEEEFGLEDGVYQVDFTTDSGMFHVNEACEGHGTLTVENGQATVHISLVSKKIVNLYLGLAADAEGDEENWLQPTEDEITYDDGTTDVVYGFDVPVQALDTEFDLALIGEKGVWYDHKVSVSNPVAQ